MDLLNYTTAIHLKRQYEDMAFHRVGKNGFLDLCTVLEQLLNDLVKSRSELQSAEKVSATHIITEDVLDELQ